MGSCLLQCRTCFVLLMNDCTFEDRALEFESKMWRSSPLCGGICPQLGDFCKRLPRNCLAPKTWLPAVMKLIG